MGSGCAERAFRGARRNLLIADFVAVPAPPLHCPGRSEDTGGARERSPCFWSRFGRGAVAVVHSSAPPSRGVAPVQRCPLREGRQNTLMRWGPVTLISGGLGGSDLAMNQHPFPRTKLQDGTLKRDTKMMYT